MCKQLLADSEMDLGRQGVFNFNIEISDAHTSSNKLDTVLEKLKSAAKSIFAFGVVLNKVKDESGRYYYVNADNT